MNITVVSYLEKGAGFFSQFFFMINHYIYSKKQKYNFVLNTNTWLFSGNNGWKDYFEQINEDIIVNENNNNIKKYYFGNITENYPIKEYKDTINEVYVYNKITKNKIIDIKQKLGINNNVNYGSILIRRGDKLIHESKLYDSTVYIKVLLDKYPECNVVYVQTDDYNCVTDIENYILIHNLKIKLLTLCKKEMKGIFLDKNNTNSVINKNINYINSIKQNINNYKSINEMNKNEIYEHMVEMIIGLDILKESIYCITDYQSNVSRFIKLIHNHPDNVFDIDGFDLDLNKLICPSYPESVYTDVDNWRHS